MPIKICTEKGKKGKKWGKSGKCYTGRDAQKKAEEQAAAAYANGYKKENNEVETEADLDIVNKEEFFRENPPTSADHVVPWETDED